MTKNKKNNKKKMINIGEIMILKWNPAQAGQFLSIDRDQELIPR
jgi:hypothetical protein